MITIHIDIFHCNVADNKCYKQKWACYFLHTSNQWCMCWCVCMCNCMHQMEKTALYPFFHVTSYLKNINIASSRLSSLESKLLPKKSPSLLKTNTRLSKRNLSYKQCTFNWKYSYQPRISQSFVFDFFILFFVNQVEKLPFSFFLQKLD